MRQHLKQWFFEETPASTRLTVPIVDIDPNRGVTLGVAPTWFLVSSGTASSIHAPAAAFNSHVGASIAYDYYLFPSSRTQLECYGYVAQTSDRELLFEQTTTPTPESPSGFSAHAQVLRDATRRFYGVGPDSSEGGQTDYTFDSINYAFMASRRILPDGPWLASVGQHLEAVRILPGPIHDLPDVEALHPGAIGTPVRHTDAAVKLSLVYDTRDVLLAPRRGVDAEAYVDLARRGWLADYSYARVGGELRAFLPLAAGDEPRAVLALDGRSEAIDGEVPFWLMPSLGGKRSLRAYGDGRFVDGFMGSTRAELRLRVADAVFSDTPVSFWTDPFLEAGAVAPDVQRLALPTVRPGYGIALRAVSRPQVVVSADFGVGLEGLKVFLDLTYAF